jgi:twinkle protein
MAQTIADSLDFEAYLRATEPAVKVRNASVFEDELLELANPEREQTIHAHSRLRKLGADFQFRPGEVSVFHGFSGSRKSMFTGQLALDLCAQGQRVLLMSMEMRPADTLWRMARQFFGVASPSQAQVAAFSRWSDGRLWIFDHMGRITPEVCIAVLRYFAAEFGGQHAFVDSLMMVVASEEHLDQQKQFATDLVRVAQETTMHLHLVAHARKPASGDESKPPSKYDIRGSAAISDQAHNVVSVWMNRGKKAKLDACAHDFDALAEHDALVTVEKQRNGPWEGRVMLWFHEPSLRFTDERTTPVDPYSLGGA